MPPGALLLGWLCAWAAARLLLGWLCLRAQRNADVEVELTGWRVTVRWHTPDGGSGWVPPPPLASRRPLLRKLLQPPATPSSHNHAPSLTSTHALPQAGRRAGGAAPACPAALV